MNSTDASRGNPRDRAPKFRHLVDEPGEPAPATIAMLGPWIVAASRPFADWYFGEPWAADEVLREWIARPTSEVFAGRAILHEDGIGPGGCVIALAGSELASCRAADFAAFCSEIEGEPGADEVIAEIVVVSNELFLPVSDDDLYISRVGVDPSRRGEGIGRAMVSYVLDVAARRGHPRCRLDVSADNEPAIRAYEAAGLRTVETRHAQAAGLTYCSMIATV